MKEKINKYARYVLTVIPAMVIILCFIPGIVQIYHQFGLGYYMVLSDIPQGTIQSALALVLVISVYVLINGIVCIRSDSNKLLKLLMVFSLTALGCSLLPLLAMLGIAGMLAWPYAIIPVLYGIQSAVAIIAVLTDETYY